MYGVGNYPPVYSSRYGGHSSTGDFQGTLGGILGLVSYVGTRRIIVISLEPRSWTTSASLGHRLRVRLFPRPTSSYINIVYKSKRAPP